MFSYIHIPFCRQKCLYCKFALTSQFNDFKIEKYLHVLKSEIRIFLDSHPHVSIESIYFGWGTPSILSIAQLRSILETFSSHSMNPLVEITMETNPEDITPEYIEWLSLLWVNRLSLGIQTLNNAALKAVGRSDSHVAKKALDTLSRGPIKNISLDLIVWLPHTTSGQINSDLEDIFTHIEPNHMSIYMLEDELYPHDWIPYLPWEEVIRKEYFSWVNFLEQKGLSRYELSNFGRPWYESRHNRAYWNHSESRGFGLSAASFVWGERFTNAPSFSGYYAGEVTRDAFLDQESLRIERIMFGMRTSWAMLADILNTKILEKYIQEWLLQIRHEKVFPTSTWIFLIDHIIGELI